MGFDPRHLRRLLPVVVLALGAAAGVLLAVVLLTRSAPPTGQASPSATGAVSDSAAASEQPSVAPSAEATADPTIEPEPSQQAPSCPARLAWTAGRPQAGVVNAVIRFGDRWIAGGWLDAPAGRGAVWTSSDGVAWSEPVLLEPEPRADVECDHHSISGFAPWNGALLAFGWNGYGCGDGGNPMVWRSPDGTAWDVVDIAGTAFAAEYPYPASAVEAPDGRLAVFASTSLGSVRALFLTSDLESWEMHQISDSFGTESSISRLAASPDLMIGVGSIVIGERAVETWTEEIYGPHVVTSIDGVAWAPMAPPVEEGTITDVAWDATNGRFVAVGIDGAGLPFAWLTTDGSRWTPIQLSDGPTYMHRVTVADGLIVATGETGTGSEPVPGDTVVWSSHDGASWWYGTVLEDRKGTVEAASADTVILISNRSTESGEESWLSLAGAVTPNE